MKKKTLLLVSAIFVVMAGTAFASEKISMAVLDLKANNVPAVTASTISDFLRLELLNTGRFAVMDRSNMDKVLQEQAFQQAGCTETDCAVKIGQILNISNIVVGSVNKLGTKYMIIINLIDVEKAEVVLGDSIESFSEEALNEAAKGLAISFSGKVPVLGKIVRVKDDEVVLNLGQDDRVSTGMKLKVERLGEEIKDDKGRVIMREREEIGEIVLTMVDKEASKAKIVGQKKTLEKGDLVKVAAVGVPAKPSAVKYEVPVAAQEMPVSKTRFGAVWRSALIPGWGKVYSEQYFRGILYFTAFSGGVVGMLINMKNTRNSRDAYLNAESPEDINTTYDEWEAHYKTGKILFGIVAGVYLINILDSWLLFPKELESDTTAFHHPEPDGVSLQLKQAEDTAMTLVYRHRF